MELVKSTIQDIDVVYLWKEVWKELCWLPWQELPLIYIGTKEEHCTYACTGRYACIGCTIYTDLCASNISSIPRSHIFVDSRYSIRNTLIHELVHWGYHLLGINTITENDVQTKADIIEGRL